MLKRQWARETCAVQCTVHALYVGRLFVCRPGGVSILTCWLQRLSACVLWVDITRDAPNEHTHTCSHSRARPEAYARSTPPFQGGTIHGAHQLYSVQEIRCAAASPTPLMWFVFRMLSRPWVLVELFFSKCACTPWTIPTSRPQTPTHGAVRTT